MKFKLDENIPFVLKGLIEKRGSHKIDSVFHEKLSGIDDKRLIQRCFKNNQVLITLDRDFINIMDSFYGIIILRLKMQEGKNAIKTLFEDFLNKISLENIIGKIIIVDPHQIRIRS